MCIFPLTIIFKDYISLDIWLHFENNLASIDIRRKVDNRGGNLS